MVGCGPDPRRGCIPAVALGGGAQPSSPTVGARLENKFGRSHVRRESLVKTSEGRTDGGRERGREGPEKRTLEPSRLQ